MLAYVKKRCGFFYPSERKEIPETINDYFSIYIEKCLDYLNKEIGVELVQHYIQLAQTTSLENFENVLDLGLFTSGNEDIKAILNVVQRLLKGRLYEAEPLMSALMKIEPRNTTEHYNLRVSEIMSKRVNDYLTPEISHCSIPRPKTA